MWYIKAFRFSAFHNLLDTCYMLHWPIRDFIGMVDTLLSSSEILVFLSCSSSSSILIETVFSGFCHAPRLSWHPQQLHLAHCGLSKHHLGCMHLTGTTSMNQGPGYPLYKFFAKFTGL